MHTQDLFFWGLASVALILTHSIQSQAADRVSRDFDCKAIEKVGTLEAGKSFAGRVEKDVVTLWSQEIGTCRGALTLGANKFAYKAEMRGSKCAVEFDVLVERTLADGPLYYAHLAVTSNDPSDIYLCRSSD